MSISPEYRGRILWASLLVGLGLFLFAPPGFSQEERLSGKTLELFLKLRLPDSKGAKWVTANGGEIMNSFMGQEGNAWLIRDYGDGTVDLIINQSQVIRARRMDEDQPSPMGAQFGSAKGSFPNVFIQPADLEKEMAAFKKALTGKPKPSSNSGGGGENNDNDAQEDPQTAQYLNPQSLDLRLLFLAHLERQGNAAYVNQVLPAFLERASKITNPQHPGNTMEPKDLLDAAITRIADGSLSQLSQSWATNGDTPAFAANLEKLAAEFTQGWMKREACLLLAKRARDNDAPNPTKAPPETEEFAAKLLAISSTEWKSIMIGGNWLLADQSNTNRYTIDTEGARQYGGMPGAYFQANSENQEGNKGNALTPLFARKWDFARSLTYLLSDHRLVRVVKREGYFFNAGSDDESEENQEKAYGALARPMELCEVAAHLLDPILPAEMESNAGDADRIREWLGDMSKLSDEDLAWGFLQGSSQIDAHFLATLSWLTANGNDAMIEKVQAVFLDKALWTPNPEPAFNALPAYLKRIKGDNSAFITQLRGVFKEALDETLAARPSNDGESEEAKRKEREDWLSGQEKRLNYILHPPAISDLLADYVADENPGLADPAARPLMTTLRKLPRTQAETQVLTAAANAKGAPKRLALLYLLQSSFQQPASGAASLPNDPKLREAIATLLNDKNDEDPENSVSLTTASYLVFQRWPALQRRKTQELAQTAPTVLRALIEADARALLEDRPLLPWPNETRVTPARLQQVTADLSAKSPAEFFPALHALSLDEQVAFAKSLDKPGPWPASLDAAALTIQKVVDQTPDHPNAWNPAHWKGRKLDAALFAELTNTADALAAEGKPFEISLLSMPGYEGLVLSLQANAGEISTFDNYLSSAAPKSSGPPPGLKDLPPPAMTAAAIIILSGEEAQPAFAKYPAWSDAALTGKWREAWLKIDLDPKAAKPPPSGKGAGGISEQFRKALQKILNGAARDRGFIRCIWYANPISKDSDTQ